MVIDILRTSSAGELIGTKYMPVQCDHATIGYPDQCYTCGMDGTQARSEQLIRAVSTLNGLLATLIERLGNG